jgi:glycosyltransferase involved in cell wall biosynthesis
MPGGVADHTRNLAEALVAAGDEVHVFVPTRCAIDPKRPHQPFVRALPDRYGPAALARLSQLIDELPRGARLLVQYTPQAFGWWGINVPFCLWLRSAARARPVDLLFHEVYSPIDPAQPLRLNLLGVVTRWMSRQVARSGQRLFVSTSAWERILRPMIRDDVPICLAPVPSNLPLSVSPDCAAVARRKMTGGRDAMLVVGHFGTYGAWFRQTLARVLPALLIRPNLCAALIGRGSDAFTGELARENPKFADRIVGTGGLSPAAAAAHLAACDLLVQPYIDGITTRRSSAMAGLALGVPTASTDGALTEPLWRQSGAVALAPAGDANALVQRAGELLDDPEQRRSLSRCASCLYRDRFDIGHTVRALREPCIS